MDEFSSFVMYSPKYPIREAPISADYHFRPIFSRKDFFGWSAQVHKYSSENKESTKDLTKTAAQIFLLCSKYIMWYSTYRQTGNSSPRVCITEAKIILQLYHSFCCTLSGKDAITVTSGN